MDAVEEEDVTDSESIEGSVGTSILGDYELQENGKLLKTQSCDDSAIPSLPLSPSLANISSFCRDIERESCEFIDLENLTFVSLDKTLTPEYNIEDSAIENNNKEDTTTQIENINKEDTTTDTIGNKNTSTDDSFGTENDENKNTTNSKNYNSLNRNFKPIFSITEQYSSFEDALWFPDTIETRNRGKNSQGNFPLSVSSVEWKLFYNNKQKMIQEKRKTVLKNKANRLKRRQEMENRKKRQTPKATKKYLKKAKCPTCKDEMETDAEEDQMEPIRCDNCDNWFHLKCSSLSSVSFIEAQKEAFICSLCINRKV